MSRVKQQMRDNKSSNKARRQVAASQNELNNELSSRDEPMSPYQQAWQENNGSRIKRETRKNDISSNKLSSEAKGSAKKANVVQRNHSKIKQIHQQSINIQPNSPPKAKANKNHLNKITKHQEVINSKKHIPINHLALQQSEAQEQAVEQEKKIKDLNAGMQKLSESIIDLRQKYEQFKKEQQKNQSNEIKSKSKIKSIIFGQKSQQQAQRQYRLYVEQKKREKQARRKVLSQVAEKDKMKLQEWRKQKQEQKQKQKRQRMNQIKSLHANLSQKNKKITQGYEQRKKAIEQFLKKYKEKQSFIDRKRKQDELKHQQKLQQSNQHLMQRKQIFKPIDFQQIDQHQKWYYGKSEELISKRREAKDQELKKIEQENEKFPEFYRGNGHQIHLEQRLQKARKKQLPLQKVKRIKDYRQYVRQRFAPRTYQNRSMEMSKVRNDSSLTHREIKRYRYYKGVSYGQMIEMRPIAKSFEEIKRIGHHNFQLMKRLPKKRDRVDAYQIKLLQERENYRNGYGKREEHYIDDKKIIKDTKIALPAEVKSDELEMVMKRLKSNDLKIKNKQYAVNSQPQIFNEASDQKKLNEQMIDNIERKISLLSQL